MIKIITIYNYYNFFSISGSLLYYEEEEEFEWIFSEKFTFKAAAVVLGWWNGVLRDWNIFCFEFFHAVANVGMWKNCNKVQNVLEMASFLHIHT